MIHSKGVASTTKTSLRNLYQDFGENTTMHGVARTLIREHWRRIVWVIMVLLCIVWAVAQFVYVLQDYYSYPAMSLVRRTYDSRLTFPAVTICNLNKVKKSSVSFTSVLSQHYIEAMIRNLESADSSVRFSALQVPWSDIVGHDLSDMMVECTFNQRLCSVRNFTYLKATSSGNCYTFNLAGNETLYSTRAGSNFGLVLEMDIESYEYTPMTTTTGIKVVVHNRDEFPFPEDEGVLASPGFVTSIGITKSIRHRLPSPYGVCVKESDHKEYSLHSSSFYKYTDTACEKLCHQNYVYQICRCCDLDLPCDKAAILRKLGNAERSSTVFFCNSTRDVSCARGLDRKSQKIRQECGKACPPACDQTAYKTDISTGYWPSDAYLELFLAKLKKTKLQNTTTEDVHMFIHKNFLRLEVYYSSLVFEEITMKPVYSWSKLLAEIGGQMGLWLGFSVLTGLEIVEFFLDILAIFSKGFLRKAGIMRQADRVLEKSRDVASITEKSGITRSADNNLEQSSILVDAHNDLEKSCITPQTQSIV